MKIERNIHPRTTIAGECHSESTDRRETQITTSRAQELTTIIDQPIRIPGNARPDAENDGFMRMSQRKRQQIDIAAINFLSFMDILLPSDYSSAASFFLLQLKAQCANGRRIEAHLGYSSNGFWFMHSAAYICPSSELPLRDFVWRSSLGRCGRETNTLRRRVCGCVCRKLLGPIHSSFTFV